MSKRLAALEKENDYFDVKKREAENTDSKLRYIASLQSGVASVRLQTVGPEHPLYHLSGNDNIIAITTARYHNQPMVIKGPGAGAEVTAAGVFADILHSVKM